MQGNGQSLSHRGAVPSVKDKARDSSVGQVIKLPSIPNYEGFSNQNSEFHRPTFELRNYFPPMSSYW